MNSLRLVPAWKSSGVPLYNFLQQHLGARESFSKNIHNNHPLSLFFGSSLIACARNFFKAQETSCSKIEEGDTKKLSKSGPAT